jgi:hypothetical protein
MAMGDREGRLSLSTIFLSNFAFWRFSTAQAALYIMADSIPTKGIGCQMEVI